MTVPANIYKGQSKPFLTFGAHMFLVAHKDVPADLVFELVQATFQHKKELSAAYKSYIVLDPQNVKNMGIPLHKGAYEYYRKAGIPVPPAAKPID